MECFDDFFPVVSTKNNFDDLLIPADHVSRSPIDTYYVDDQHVLRTHTRWGWTRAERRVREGTS